MPTSPEDRTGIMCSPARNILVGESTTMQVVHCTDAGSTSRMYRWSTLGSLTSSRRTRCACSTSDFRGSEKTSIVGVKVTRHWSEIHLP